MNKSKKCFRLICLGLAAVLLAGCGRLFPAPNPTPVPSQTPAPSNTPTLRLSRTPTVTPTLTSTPTETPTPSLSPTITETLTPTRISAIPGSSWRGEFTDGILTFNISPDGQWVQDMKIVIRRATRCKDGKRLGEDVRLLVPYQIPINEYGFPTRFGTLEFYGWFSTARTVTGWFVLPGLEVPNRAPCTLERVEWSGAIQ
ncbi:MAG: hypothetical protein AB1894_10125 [Chloroflexota bacterium]